MNRNRLFIFGIVAVAGGLSNFSAPWMVGAGGTAMILVAIFA